MVIIIVVIIIITLVSLSPSVHVYVCVSKCDVTELMLFLLSPPSHHT